LLEVSETTAAALQSRGHFGYAAEPGLFRLGRGQEGECGYRYRNLVRLRDRYFEMKVWTDGDDISGATRQEIVTIVRGLAVDD